MVEQKLGALILAAGLSSRMKGLKPLLHIGEKKIIEHAIELFTASGVEAILTVIGHRADEVLPVIKTTTSHYVINDQYRDGMFSSIQKGAEVLRDGCACDGFFLLPVDIPLVQPSTVRQLIDAFSSDASHLVCYPQFQSRRGHPPLIAASLTSRILAYGGDDGMRGVLRQYEGRALDVSVEDPFILMDVDTPEELEFLKKEYQKQSHHL